MTPQARKLIEIAGTALMGAVERELAARDPEASAGMAELIASGSVEIRFGLRIGGERCDVEATLEHLSGQSMPVLAAVVATVWPGQEAAKPKA